MLLCSCRPAHGAAGGPPTLLLSPVGELLSRVRLNILDATHWKLAPMNLLAVAAFATMDETAIAALRHAAATCDPHYECGGVVRKVDGGFEASALTTSYKPFGVDLEGLYGSDVVADFHTHICSIHNQPFADFFSPADAMANQGLHTVGYMLSLCDRNIRRYDPTQDDRDDEEVDFHSGLVIYLTIGHIVGWAPPDDRFTTVLRDSGSAL